MVTLIKYGSLSGGVKYNVNVMKIDGLSTDTKPTGYIEGMAIPNGSIYTEVDSGTRYRYDAENATWYEASSGGGGGGGGIKLVGETTTPLTDGATTNPITIEGQSYTAQPNDAVLYDSKEFLYVGTYWREFGDMTGLGTAAFEDVPESGDASSTEVVMGNDSRLARMERILMDSTESQDYYLQDSTPTNPSDGDYWFDGSDLVASDITAMTGYAKAQTASAIGTSDTLNQAIGKLEKALDLKQDTIDSTHKINSDYISDDNSTNKFVTAQQITKINNIGKVIHIGVGQEYTSLRAGIEAAVLDRNSIVYVHDGTYDLAQEYAAEIEANVPNEEFGILLHKDVHIIFSSGAYVTAEYTGQQSNIVMCFAPFMARDDGGYTIENLRMSAKNVRYCIHDEGNGFTLPRNVKILNCQLKMDNTTAPLTWYPQCIGGGFGISDNILIDNCVFESISSLAKPYPALSYHNNGSIPTGSSSHCHLVVSNCYFVDGTFRITHYGNSTYKSVGYINNCNLPTAPIIKYETSTTSTPENVELISENNIIREDVARIINSDGTKNLNKQSDITATATGFTDFYPIDLPMGHYVVSLTKSLSNTAAIALYDDNSTTLIAQKTFTVGSGSDTWDFDLSSDVTRFRVYFNATNDSLTNIMFCTKTAWDISNTNVPYIPTNAELSETIDGQQNTVASGGNGYALINGIRLYASHTAPTGDIPDGSIGVGW